MKFFQFSTCQWNLLGVFVLLLVVGRKAVFFRNFINKWFRNLHELKYRKRAILSRKSTSIFWNIWQRKPCTYVYRPSKKFKNKITVINDLSLTVRMDLKFRVLAMLLQLLKFMLYGNFEMSKNIDLKIWKKNLPFGYSPTIF